MLQPQRRKLVLAALAMGLPWSAHAAWPERAIRIVVPATPGSPPDIAVRAISDLLASSLNQAVVVENRAGGMGLIGMGVVASAPGDGYTFGAMNLQLAAVPALRKSMPFALDKLVPVAQLTLEGPVLAVHADQPVHTMAELIEHIKARAGDITFGSSGNASPSHLGMELLLRHIGAKARHIPYGGAAPAATGLASGQVQMALLGSGSVLPMVASGRVRAIAVSADQRIERLATVPTFAQAGFGDIDVQGWVGLVAAPGTPAAVAERMNEAVNAALRDPAVRTRLGSVGSQARGGTAGAFGTFIQRETARWQEVVREARIEAQ